MASSSSMEIEQTVTTPAASQPLPEQQTLTGKFCRCLFTLIFYLQLILISGLVIFLALRGLLFTKSPSFHPKKWYTPLLASVAVSGVLSLAWQCFFICNKVATVKATFVLAPLLTLSFTLFLLYVGDKNLVSVLIGLPTLIFSIGEFCYSWINACTNSHGEFSFTIMTHATALPPARTRAIAFFSVVLSVFYSAFMVVGIGGATATRTRLDILFISLIMISLAWNMQVLKNVQQAAISKATYVFFRRDEVMNACDALCATLKSHLGSVCIGSTLIPVVVLLRGVIRGCYTCDTDSKRAMYRGTGERSWIGNHMILYGNRWGFVHVGVSNKSYIQSSRDTWLRFRGKAGMEELIDCDLTSSICFHSAISVGAISAFTAGIWAYLIHRDYSLQLTLYASIIGYFVSRVASAWLQGCVMGYYVAYSDNPQSDKYDNTIPQRIAKQDQMERHNEAYEERLDRLRREREEEEEISYM